MTRRGEARPPSALLDFPCREQRLSSGGEIMTARLTSTLLGGLAAAFLTTASLPATPQAPAHVMDNLTGTKWGTAPPMLPPGAQIAVVNGDPTKAVPYTVRLK